MKDIFILAIESSCDETSMAIVKNGNEVIGLSTNTQIPIHELYGGVVPELASRMHTENVLYVLDDLLKKTNFKLENIDAVAVTCGPGLTGSLLIGIEAAKVISYLYNKPLIAVNHIIGHIYANALTKKLSFPTLALIVSGGHTNLVYMKDNYKFEILGGTLDDAIGEAFDKVARVLDLKYPGGPNIEKLAKNGKTTYKLPIPMNNQSMDFSFSGLKSGIINLVHNEIQRGNEINKEDLACSFQNIAVDEVVRKLEIAINKTKVSNVIVAGGVSANTYLRDKITELTKQYNINLGIPDLKYCTDNAAMIGAAAYYLYLKKDFSDLNLQPQPNKSLN